MSEKISNQAFLMLTNSCSMPFIQLFENLRLSVSNFGDAYIVYHSHDNNVPDALNTVEHHLFSDKILTQLNYKPIFNSLVPGSNHFPLLDFFLKNPFYDYYWYIEDDVRYNGDWTSFFNAFNFLPTPDFISCHIRTFDEEPRWRWWHTLAHPCNHIPAFSRIRSFNPIYRVSKESLYYIHHRLIDKWQGHHEVLIPTLLHLEGFRIMDFGGKGKFVVKGYENKFYESSVSDIYGNLNNGSMRFRPLLQETDIQECRLYHPIKI